MNFRPLYFHKNSVSLIVSAIITTTDPVSEMEDRMEHKALEYLSELYPTVAKAATEIINLQSIINLPKGTEHFLSDIHGEYEAFSHVLRNGSGAVRKKIDDVFGHTLNQAEKKAVATLIYYPREKIEEVKKNCEDLDDWYKVTLYRLIEICKTVTSKYTRSKVRKALPADYAYIIEELITEKSEVLNKGAYYETIVQTIIEIGRAEKFIIAMAELIWRMVIDHLHIVGDIYDRGPGPHLIMEDLMQYHSLDIQWGNHDVLWLGAAAGHPACIATIIRLCLRYGNMNILEDGYGINLLPLAALAMETYAEDEATCFTLKNETQERPLLLERRMHKAISIIQFKLEAEVIGRHPEYGLEQRRLLRELSEDRTQVRVEGEWYPLRDTHFPTIDAEQPEALTEAEAEVMQKLVVAFKNCDKLQRHMRFLLRNGALYKVYNGNLLYHGCVPMTETGERLTLSIDGENYGGKALYDKLDWYVRRAYFSTDAQERQRGADLIWYLWSGPISPLFGRGKMATFERYLLADKGTHKEEKNAYYHLIEEVEIAEGILAEFGLTGDQVHIINGHMPIHAKVGESPIKCGGRVLMIDGGFSKAYQGETGIAGYTLTYNSYGLALAAHEPFDCKRTAVQMESDMESTQVAVEHSARRMLVGDTDSGKQMQRRIMELKELIAAYRAATIKER